MFINKSVLIHHQSYNVSLQIVRNFIPKNFLSGLLPRENEEKKEPIDRDLKKWRTLPNFIDEKPFLTSFKRTAPNKVFPNFFGRGSLSAAEDTELYLKTLRIKSIDSDQKFIPERHQILGNDLAVAHIILFRNGRIRQLGSENFLSNSDIDDLPTTYKANWFLEEIDYTNIPISYKGLLNLKGLRYLKKATFKNCDYFDNWCLDRVIAICPHLEYLNVTDCKGVDEKGLECLYKAWDLKEFVVTDWRNNFEFELTCLLVEDCKPGLVVKRLVKSSEEVPSDLDNPYTPTSVERFFIALEKLFYSKQHVNQRQMNKQQ